MALEKLEYPATGTVTESWSPTRNPSYAGAVNEKDMGVAREISAGNKAYTYGSALWTYFIRRAYRSLTDKEKAELENFAGVVGGDEFKFTDHNGVPWKVRFEDFRRAFNPQRGDRWDLDFILRAEVKAAPSFSLIPSQFHRDLLFYAPLRASLDAFSRWDPTATFARATTATYRGSNGVLQTAASGAARHEYSAALAALGVLIEGQRTNLIVRNQEFENAAWTKRNVSPTADAIAGPDGVLNAEKYLETVDNSVHDAYQGPPLADNTVYTHWVMAKGGLGRDWIYIRFRRNDVTDVYAWFNITTGTIGTVQAGGAATIEALNGWYLSALTVNSLAGASQVDNFIAGIATGDGVTTYAGDVTKGMYFTGGSAEAGNFRSSLIPTVGASVTRNADVLTYPAQGHIAPQGTIFFVAEILGTIPGASNGLLYFDDGSSNNSIWLVSNSGNQPRGVIIAAGVTQVDIAVGAGADDFAPLVKKSLALTFQANDAHLYSSGVDRVSDASLTMPSGLTTIRIGRDASGLNGYCHLRDLCIFARVLTAAEILTLHNALI